MVDVSPSGGWDGGNGNVWREVRLEEGEEEERLPGMFAVSPHAWWCCCCRLLRNVY